MADCSLDVPQDTLDQQEVLFTCIVHVETNLLNSMRDVKTGESEVLERTGKATMQSWIGDWGASFSSQLGACFDWCSARVARERNDVGVLTAEMPRK